MPGWTKQMARDRCIDKKDWDKYLLDEQLIAILQDQGMDLTVSLYHNLLNNLVQVGLAGFTFCPLNASDISVKHDTSDSQLTVVQEAEPKVAEMWRRQKAAVE
jgi:hypothetical protein